MSHFFRSARIARIAHIAQFAVQITALVAVLAGAGAARAADVAAGKAIFDKTCAVCHSSDAGVNKVGPSLFDVVDRPVASVPGFDYSEKMRAVALELKVWNEANLDAYLTHPRQVLHGVKMFFAVPDPQDRADIIAYLKMLR